MKLFVPEGRRFINKTPEEDAAVRTYMESILKRHKMEYLIPK